MTTAAPQWSEVKQAVEFAQERFRRWHDDRVIRPDQNQAIQKYYEDVQFACGFGQQHGEPVPEDLDLPPAGEHDEQPEVRKLRFLSFLCREIDKHKDAGRLSLALAHSCLLDCRQRMAKLNQQLSQQGITLPPAPAAAISKPMFAALAEALEEAAPTAPPKEPPAPRRPLLEIILDPRNIQWLLGTGGALMVVGLVILLWVNELLTPPVVALSLGIANAALLFGGWAVLRYSRYQLAGRALTLLACLVMPLNLWYYHSNTLMTVDGHLWVAALVISALYAASALVLKEPIFVYVFLGGVTLTGLLALADLPPSPQKFWEIASPATMLVVLGLLAIHVEQAFADKEGPFSRKRFGLAFFWSGHAQLASGLLLLFGAWAAADWFYPLFESTYQSLKATKTPVVTETWGQLLSLGLVLAGAYAYFYSDLVVRRVGVYVYVAALCLIWAEVLGVRLLRIELGVDAIIALLAVTALLANLAQAGFGTDNKYARALPGLGLAFSLLPVFIGLLEFVKDLSPDLRSVWKTEAPGWGFVGAMALTAVACRVGAHLYRQRPKLLATYFFATTAATMVGAVALLAALGLERWEEHAPILMVLPIIYLLAARVYRGQPMEQPLRWVSHAATAVMLVSSLVSLFDGFTRTHEQAILNLSLAAFCAEAAVFFALDAAFYKLASSIRLGALMACGAVWQLLTFWGLPGEFYSLTFAIVGLGLLVAYRFAVLERFGQSILAGAAFQSANVLLSLSFVASLFMGLSRLAADRMSWSYIGLCILLGLMALAAVALVRESGWRRWYVVAAVSQGLLIVLAVQMLSELSPWQKLEAFSVAAGLLLLVIGHLGWFREQEQHSDMVSLCLLLGSLLAAFPLAVATLVDRSRGDLGDLSGWLILNEIGFLAVSILLLVTGFMFQLKSTTLTGAFFSVLYFVTLLLYVPWSRLNTVAIVILVGGGFLFGTGLILSVYRERLLALPDKIKKREGIFRVLGWR